MADFASIDKNDPVIQNLKAEFEAINKLYNAATDPAAKAAYDAQRYAIHQRAEDRRNDLGYSGDLQGNPSSFVGIVTGAAEAAQSVVNKVTEPVKAAAEKVSEPAAAETKVIYSSFDPDNYAAQQISGGVSDQTASNIIGIGIIAVIGFVILDKLIG